MLQIAVEMSRLEGKAGNRLLKFLAPALNERNQRTELYNITDDLNLVKFQNGSLDHFVNFHRVNDFRRINGFFKSVNAKLAHGGSFTGCMETLEHRRERLMKKFPWGINALYYTVDFAFKRIFPKFKYTKKLYLFLTNGRNRALSKSEVLGRLVYCGFSIDEVAEINGKLYFRVIKKSDPSSDSEPSTGLILRVPRIGHKGKLITVYKFRTMHPYAQYIQDYVFACNKLREGGKFADDFRITKWGRWMRKCWIDEIPMLYNICRGDLKLVGVRPLSEHYLSLYTPEHKRLRVNGKPGLIPPFYADMPKNIDEIMESESRYILAYVAHPYTTDFNYCLKAFNNIFLNRARSH